MNYKEIETKYRADGIGLEAFKAFCEGLEGSPYKYLAIAGYDHLYDDTRDASSFGRHRVGPNFNQWTTKRKLIGANNYIRDEYNIMLSPEETPDKVKPWVTSQGYQFNVSIFKNVFLYEYDSHVLSYYVVYDADLKELGRFIEIEMSESRPWNSEDEAWDYLVKVEESMKVLGLTPQKRVKRSLYEQYRRG